MYGAVRHFFNQHMQNVVGVGCSVVGLVSLYPQVWGLHKYKEVVQHYTEGEPTPVDEDSKRLTTEVLMKMNIDVKTEAAFDLFTIYGQDPASCGSTYTRGGVVLGVPYYFRYKTVDDVEKEKITLCNKAIDWNTEQAKELCRTMIFSERAKKFALAREINRSNSVHIYIEPVIAPLCILMGYWVGFAVNRLYRLRTRTALASRFLLYGIIGSVTGLFYFLTLDSYHCQRDRHLDSQVANRSQEFAEGGVEFYNQLLERNKIMRALMGEEGKKFFTIYGNEYHSWRTQHELLTSRRDKIVSIVKNKYNQTEEK